MGFLGPIVYVEDCLRFCIEEGARFGRLDAVIHPVQVVVADVFVVKEHRIDGTVPPRSVQLSRKAQEYSPELCLGFIKSLD